MYVGVSSNITIKTWIEYVIDCAVSNWHPFLNLANYTVSRLRTFAKHFVELN